MELRAISKEVKFMCLSIKPIHDDPISCMSAVLATICNYCSIDFQFVYIGSWGFYYNTDKNIRSIGERLSNCEHVEAGIRVLAKCAGLQLTVHDGFTPETAIQFIQTELNDNRPVMIRTDIYWCPWNKYYQKIRMPHFYLIIGLGSSDEIILLDPFFDIDVHKITFNQFSQGFYKCVSYYGIDESDVQKNKVINIKQSLHYVNKVNQDMQIFLKMRDFANDIASLNMKIETNDSDDMQNVQLFNKLNNIYLVRKSIYHAFNFVAQTDAEYTAVALQMEAITDYWQKLKYNLMRCSIYSDYQTRLEEMKTRMLKIADAEENLSNVLMQYAER